MTTNSVGVVLCAVAVGAILLLHGCHRTETSEKVTEPAHAVPPPTPKPAVEPKVEAKPVAPKHDKAFYAPGKYRRVLPGGKVDGTIDCTYVPPIAKAYPPDMVLKYAKAHELTPAQLNNLRLCLK
jgi:hypothetical protein